MSGGIKEKKEKPASGYKPVVPAVDQALQVLNCLSESAGSRLTLTEICARLNLHKSKVYTLLNTLKNHDFIERDEQTKTYSLGLGILYLARNVLKNMNIRNLAMPFLQELAEQTGGTAHLGTISGNRLVIVARRDVREDLDYGLREGSTYHITHGSHGKAIVAFMPEAEREAILAGDTLEFYGNGKPIQLDALRRELGKALDAGYAADPGETSAGMIVISSPVFDQSGKIIGCIILTGNFTRSKIGACGPKVHRTARLVSAKLGYERL